MKSDQQIKKLEDRKKNKKKRKGRHTETKKQKNKKKQCVTCAPRLRAAMPSSKAEWVSTWGGIPAEETFRQLSCILESLFPLGDINQPQENLNLNSYFEASKRGEVLLHISYMGMCHGMVLDIILTGKYETTHVHLFLLLFWHWPGTLIFKENKPLQKVIGLDNVIKDHFKWCIVQMETSPSKLRLV